MVLATVDRDVGPGPVGAARRAADNGNIGGVGVNSSLTRDVLDGEAGDGDAAGGITAEVTTVVVLLNQDAETIIHE